MRLLADLSPEFEIVVIDSANQISPIMENAIYPTDLFIVPFESTKAVRGTPTSTGCSSPSWSSESARIPHGIETVWRISTRDCARSSSTRTSDTSYDPAGMGATSAS